MKGKKKKKVIKSKAPLSKSLGELMKDENGFVSKETILKVGLSTVAALGMTGAMTDISSGAFTHTNIITVPGTPDNCVDHQNITVHNSY